MKREKITMGSKTNRSSDAYLVDASPTKALFISIITRDVELSRAIADLIDNSVDAAVSQRKKDLSPYQISVSFDSKRFSITDNCGGMDPEYARHFAFRLGRAEDAPLTPHSIGEFGIGMKRSIFKMGNLFRMVSTAKQSRFVIKLNIPEWSRVKEWQFRFTELSENKKQPADELGTMIEVTDLHRTVADEFVLANFQSRLREELTATYEQVLARGLVIALNGIPLGLAESQMFESDTITAAHETREIETPNGIVRTTIIAGVANGKPADAGWHVFCNGRLILDADKSLATGWGAADGFPHFHNQYSRFRGFVFFDSDNKNALPWNTSKSALNPESPVFQNVRERMIEISKPIIAVLNKLKKEKEKEGESPIEKQLQKARSVSVSHLAKKLKEDAPFTMKVTPARRTPDRASVTYTVTKAKLEIVKESLNAKNNTEVGERTFNYYFRMECE